MLLAVAAPCAAPAANYDYDQLGRLVRSIDSQGRVTEYVYDPAGNLLQVIQGGVAAPPAVSGVSPATIRRNQALQVQITGAGLNGISLQSDDPAIHFSAQSVSATAVTFRLLIFRAAALGQHSITLRNAAGTASVQFEVQEEIQYVIGPPPFALAPDGSTRHYRIDASIADPHPLDLTVSSFNTGIARPGPEPVSLPAGATSTTGTAIGIAAGNTTFRFTSPGLVEPIDVRVGVTSEFGEAMLSRSRPLGLVKGDPAAPGANAPADARSRALGLLKGDPLAPGASAPSNALSPGLGIEKN